MIDQRRRKLMDRHRQEADEILDEEWRAEIAANAFFMAAVIGAAIILNLLVLVLIVD
jgi:hypothetical protein